MSWSLKRGDYFQPINIRLEAVLHIRYIHTHNFLKLKDQNCILLKCHKGKHLPCCTVEPPKTDTLRDRLKCPSYIGVRLIEVLEDINI